MNFFLFLWEGAVCAIRKGRVVLINELIVVVTVAAAVAAAKISSCENTVLAIESYGNCYHLSTLWKLIGVYMYNILLLRIKSRNMKWHCGGIALVYVGVRDDLQQPVNINVSASRSVWLNLFPDWSAVNVRQLTVGQLVWQCPFIHSFFHLFLWSARSRDLWQPVF